MWRDLVPDLLLGGTCAGCGAPGRPWCPECRTATAGGARPCWPTPCPPGLAPPWAVGDYADPLKPLVLGHKEHGRLALAGPLGQLLARAIADGVPVGPLLLVPIPSRWLTVRRRGHAPTLRMTRAAATVLRSAGREVHVESLLALRAGVADQAGLDAAARQRNLAASMWCPPERLRRAAGLRGHVVLCDDVITTGATAREGQRALAAVGVETTAIAAVAATVRRKTASIPAIDGHSLAPAGPTG